MGDGRGQDSAPAASPGLPLFVAGVLRSYFFAAS